MLQIALDLNGREMWDETALPLVLLATLSVKALQMVAARRSVKRECQVTLRSPDLIDPAVSTLVWPTGADFAPTVLHDWPAPQAAFVTQARQWATTGAEVAGEGPQSEVRGRSGDYRTGVPVPRSNYDMDIIFIRL